MRGEPLPETCLYLGLIWSSVYYDNWHQTKCSEISDGGYTDCGCSILLF